MNKNLNLSEGYLVKGAMPGGGGKILRERVETIRKWTGANERRTKRIEALPFKTLFSNQLLASQPEDSLAGLLPYLQRVSINAEEYIYMPGDEIEYVYFPETAVFSEFQILEDGRTVEIAMTGREGVVGLSTVFSDCRARNWVQVSVEGTVLKINAQILREEFNRRSALQSALHEYVNSYIRQISQRVICNSYHTVEKRLCSWLLMLQDRNKNNRLPLTQEQIARFLGVHRPSVTQIAQVLRKRKIINYIRGKISILNRQELENSACECYEVVHRGSLNSLKSVKSYVF